MTASDDARRLYQRWMEMWNGDLAAADEIFAADCVAHPAPTTTGEPPVFRGPDEMQKFVEMGRAIFDEVTFRAEENPIVEGNRLACRWASVGTYAGGMPGASAEPGTTITFRGIDVWRLEDGKVAEYWVASDGLHLMAQLCVGQ
jgi:predicted ester cyclase